MSIDSSKRHRHFLLTDITVVERFSRPAGGGPKTAIPEQNRDEHASRLFSHLSEVRTAASLARPVQEDAGVQSHRIGIQVEFQSFRDISLVADKLAREHMGIELCSVRESDGHIFATVFVPIDKIIHFEKLFTDYVNKKTDKNGRLIDNRQLVDSIKRLRVATLQALWTDKPELFPVGGQPVWWEVWLSSLHDQDAAETFRRLVEVASRTDTTGSLSLMRLAKGQLRFPERTVVMLNASVDQLQESFMIFSNVTELRKPKKMADFDSLSGSKQQELLTSLLNRTHFPPASDDVPYICLLDTGVNRAHPLIAPVLADTDLHSVEPGWSTADDDGHGTEMAGVALFGNLADVLDSNKHVKIAHRLESVKILPSSARDANDPRHYGYVIQEAVARPDVIAPGRLRLFSMPVTACDDRDAGRPSAWSSAVDKIAVGADADHAPRRLLLVSAGNAESDRWHDYPDSNDTDGIHDPAQAWNVLTVGAYTDLVFVTESDVQDEPIAQQGALSPFSTTSLPWESYWPLKPDIVFEGGNLLNSPGRPLTTDSLSLLTTSHQFGKRPTSLTWATSAATALASRFAARVMAVYPDLWPETIRGLIVHSATWTKVMKEMYLAQQTKSAYVGLLRRCGFGVPDLESALWSVANSLTMVVQEHLQPFTISNQSHEITLRDMHVHYLPWPKKTLEEIGDAEVEMRITLSYFIEPNPSSRGVRSRYRYESCGLRFDVQRPLESEDGFRKRINARARSKDEDTRQATETDSGWLIGSNGRHRGSLHGDIWQGTAATLAQRGRIAIYPTTGWWKTRKKLSRHEDQIRYALIVSIKTTDDDVDLYSEVSNLIAQPTAVETSALVT